MEKLLKNKKALIIAIVAIVAVVGIVIGVSSMSGGDSDSNSPVVDSVGKDEKEKPTEKEKISEEKLTTTLLSMNYYVSPYSINIGRVLSYCSPDYEIEFLGFDEAKKDMLSQAQIEAIEQSDEYETENIYFAVVTGTCIYNPSLPEYTSDEQVLLKMLLVFNDNEELTHDMDMYLSQDVIAYATTANMVEIVF